MLPSSVNAVAQLSGGKSVKVVARDGVVYDIADHEDEPKQEGPTDAQICMAMLQREQADLIAKTDALQKTVETNQASSESLREAVQVLGEGQVAIMRLMENVCRILMLPVKATYENGKAVGAIRVDDKKEDPKP